ncbi:MobA/MobL family protein, partial [Acetobacter thailandicus]
MAIYRAETKPISRSAGRSVVAAAAYRSGEDLTNEIDGREHKYSPRQSSVAHKAIFVPGGGSVDRSDLWNGAETSEKRKDARTGREW